MGSINPSHNRNAIISNHAKKKFFFSKYFKSLLDKTSTRIIVFNFIPCNTL